LRVPDAARSASRPPGWARRGGLADPCLRAVRNAVVSVPDAPTRRASGEPDVHCRQYVQGGGAQEVNEVTLGGYQARHDRAPSFTGLDGRAYSVAMWVED